MPNYFGDRSRPYELGEPIDWDDLAPARNAQVFVSTGLNFADCVIMKRQPVLLSHCQRDLPQARMILEGSNMINFATVTGEFTFHDYLPVLKVLHCKFEVTARGVEPDSGDLADAFKMIMLQPVQRAAVWVEVRTHDVARFAAKLEEAQGRDPPAKYFLETISWKADGVNQVEIENDYIEEEAGHS